MARMLASSDHSWCSAGWRSNDTGRRRARAREHAAWRLEEFGDDVTHALREYWSSLLDDECAPTAAVWRACVENVAAEASLPIGYDGTWHVGP